MPLKGCMCDKEKKQFGLVMIYVDTYMKQKFLFEVFWMPHSWPSKHLNLEDMVLWSDQKKNEIFCPMCKGLSVLEN